MTLIRRHIMMLLALATAMAAIASPPALLDSIVGFDDEDVLVGAFEIMQDEDAPLSDANYSLYPFIKIKNNVINLNGADWSALRRRIAAINDTVVSIVHIGDSHLQAEGATSRTRALLERFYGSSGRGLITPFRLAGTNQPFDYRISSNSQFASSTLLRKPWATPMGFTGVGITPKTEKFDITLSTKRVDGRMQDFDVIKVYCEGSVPRLTRAFSDDAGDIKYDTSVSADTLSITLYEPVTAVTLDFEANGRCTIHGFKLENSMMGLEYHVIGNNGARYSNYTALPHFGADLRALSPNLIILSLGTNDAFGTVTDATLYNQIDRLVKDLRMSNPDAQILLVTPAECMRSTRVKRRRVYTPNTNIKRVRNVILKYGREHKIATYDWYDVAGGDGASNLWLQKELLSSDRIHDTLKGYELQGNLMYDALVTAFN